MLPGDWDSLREELTALQHSSDRQRTACPGGSRDSGTNAACQEDYCDRCRVRLWPALRGAVLTRSPAAPSLRGGRSPRSRMKLGGGTGAWRQNLAAARPHRVPGPGGQDRDTAVPCGSLPARGGTCSRPVPCWQAARPLRARPARAKPLCINEC